MSENSEQSVNKTEKQEQKPFCLKLFDISTTKSACLVPLAKPFEQAYDYCKENDMSLLEVNSESEKKKLFKISGEFFGSGGGTVIWIDGKWMYDKEEWRKYRTNERFSLSKKIQTPLAKFFGNDDYCLSVQSYFMAQYEIAPIRCFNKCYFFCEYKIKKKN